MAEALGVGMVGYAFMGAAHSQAWRTAPHVSTCRCSPGWPRCAAGTARRRRPPRNATGWAAVETDWRALLERDDVQLIDMCTPGDTHAEIAVAALEAGKHVLCEKPLANTVAEAEEIAAAAAPGPGPGVRSMVGFNYRRVRPSRWPASSSPRAGSARSGTSGPATCRTG